MSDEKDTIRLNLFLSKAGVASRNQSANLIKAGKISVNGEIIKIPYYEVKPDDVVTHNGKVVRIQKKYTYIVINKSAKTPIHAKEIGEDATRKPSVTDLIKRWTEEELTPLGRPNDTVSGLVVLTDDTELHDKFEKDDHNIKSVYEVSSADSFSDDDLNILNEIPEKLTFRLLSINRPHPDKPSIIGVETLGGTFQDIVDYFKMKAFTISHIDCTFIAGITKKDLKRGWSRHLAEKEVVFLKHFS